MVFSEQTFFFNIEIELSFGVHVQQKTDNNISYIDRNKQNV